MTMIMIMVIVVIMSILFLSIFFHADPTFISSSYIPSEEKVYFFFSERADTGSREGAIHSRVGRVCVVRTHTHTHTASDTHA